MNEFEKLDAILKKVKRHNGKLTYKYIFTNNHFTEKLEKQELIEIIDKLEKDNYVKYIEKDFDKFYSLTFEGRSFLEKGGYLSNEIMLKSNKRTTMFKSVAIVVNAIIIILFGFLSYKETVRANNNEDEVKKLNREIEHLKRVNEKLRTITGV